MFPREVFAAHESSRPIKRPYRTSQEAVSAVIPQKTRENGFLDASLALGEAQEKAS
jgi:hypothetical protein